jgi:hypothetical protein
LLDIKQDVMLRIHGHAIEWVDICEDVDNISHLHRQITHHRLLSGPGIRVERGIDLNERRCRFYYDPIAFQD